ncbi:MAG: STAS domain-containing protein [Clostridia bacterium]|nr:STAS domain-containing protein [Clostridia bacterium]
MLHKNCSFETRLSGQVLELALRGEIDHHNAVRVRGDMDEQIRRHCPRETVLDLSEIDFMDSSGLGLIMGRYALMQQMGGTLSLKNPNERIVKILELAGFGRVISIVMDKPCKKEGEQ